MNETNLPVAVIGAGPIGLAAAAHLVKRGETPLVFEAGPGAASAIQSWAHVTLFSPWEFNVDAAAAELLAATGWQRPPAGLLPTGGELINHYLAPLAAHPAVSPHIHYNARVTGVSRRRHDKMKDYGRAEAPFVLQVDVAGRPERFLAKAVIDASGNWLSPNPLGADGLTAPGETAHAANIFYGIPDVLGSLRERYAGRRVAVVGGGHSAINALLELTDLQAEAPQTTIHWILRKRDVTTAYGGLGADALPGRGQLGLSMKEMVDAGRVQVHTPFYVTEIGSGETGLLLAGETPAGPATIPVDEIIAATG
ncbi:MAG: NAD(P)-binding domain-containing protein, partial [Anaerolineales bacterium]|nr:NAD(P)-binding domain-containing protein [Anaerolineales bacterium]